MRRILDVRNIDTSVEIFGRKWKAPLVIAPTGHQRDLNPDGKLAVARTAKNKKRIMMLSNVTSTSEEEVKNTKLLVAALGRK